MIVEAFAAGDRETLGNLLSTTPMPASTAPSRSAKRPARRSAPRRATRISPSIRRSRGKTAEITLRIVSDQVNLTIAQDGSVAAGAEAVTEITDLWTFQREVGASDPTWKLVGTRPA